MSVVRNGKKLGDLNKTESLVVKATLNAILQTALDLVCESGNLKREDVESGNVKMTAELQAELAEAVLETVLMAERGLRECENGQEETERNPCRECDAEDDGEGEDGDEKSGRYVAASGCRHDVMYG